MYSPSFSLFGSKSNIKKGFTVHLIVALQQHYTENARHTREFRIFETATDTYIVLPREYLNKKSKPSDNNQGLPTNKK